MTYLVISQLSVLSVKSMVRLKSIEIIHQTQFSSRFKTLKPVNSTRFQYFATLIGFNETNIEENRLLKNFLADFTGSIDVNLDAMSAVTAALEQLLALPSFTSEQATSILKIVDLLVNVTGQIEIINDDSSLKTITNKFEENIFYFKSNLFLI